MRKLPGVGAVVLAGLSVLAPAAHGEPQYFGRNKVQYKSFQFETIETEHFRIYFYPEARDAAADVARMAERWYARLSRILDHELSTPQPIVIYASAPDFRQTNVVAGGIGEGVGGVTEGLKRRIVMPLAGTLAETDHVLGHELVHAFQYDISSRQPGDMAGSSLGRLPLWFVEGMAEYLSVGHVDPHTAMWIRDAARADARLPDVRQLGNPEYFPYRWGQALWAYVAGRWGDAAVRSALDEALQSGSAAVGLERVTGLSEKELSAQWHEAIHAQYARILRATGPASAHGHPLTDLQARGALAVSPSLSPDGTRIVYLSARDMLSVDLYLAEADTGRVIRKLVNTAIDPHLSSLQFIGSAGAWSPDGRRFAIAAIRQGRPELAILDVERGERMREIPFPDLGEIFNPSWSPDGRSIAFSGTVGGHSDLFVYDLEAGAHRRLTSDAFADLQPAWSPDGTRLAFVTDRFTTDLSLLHAGRLGLALLDPVSGSIEPLPTFDRGKSINPQWASGGASLYFLSDESGITNLYGVDVANGRVSRLSALDTGASGITALSPALSTAAAAPHIAFSAYEGGRLAIYVTDPASLASGGPQTEPLADGSAAVLPPAERTGDLSSVLADATLGLPPEVTADPTPYKPRLSLDFVGQPYVSAGATRFGPAYGGGIAFSFSDMLGNHNLYTTIDVNNYGLGLGSFASNIGGYAIYENTSRRLNWNVSGGQVPYLTGGFASAIGVVDGQPALIEQTFVQRQIYRGLATGIAYPLSETRRIEFGTGYQQASFDQQIRTTAVSLATGRTLADDRVNNSLGQSLHLGSFNAAAVFDTSVFGATSPVAGQRSRFEVSPTVGTLAFTGALADYRRYFQPARFYTLAGRVMHYGRYGRDSEHGMLLPLFLGYPELVRGYGPGSYRASECAAGPSGSCEAFDRLLGSRMLVGNLEFRFPLLRPFGTGHGMYGPVPIEVAFFADAGVAWTRADRPSLFGGSREPVSSAGVTLRANVFGFAVAQLDFARPFQRPGRGWVWAISLSPGF